MSEAPELLAAIDALVAALGHRGVRYFITGSVASSIHGEYRATNDIDIVAALSVTDIEPLFAELSAAFVTDANQAREALSARSSFNLIHRDSFLKVDVFPCESAFNNEAARRADLVRPPGASETFRIATKEDILLSKLWWYRLGGEESEVQRRDIRGLIALNRVDLDMKHVRHWAAALGVADLLDDYLSSAR